MTISVSFVTVMTLSNEREQARGMANTQLQETRTPGGAKIPGIMAQGLIILLYYYHYSTTTHHVHLILAFLYLVNYIIQYVLVY